VFATSGKSLLAYDVTQPSEGSGTDILLVHAGVTDRRSWEPLTALLSGQGRIVSYDARGYGDTTYEPEPFTRHGDALAVMDAAQVDTAVVVGSSKGGGTAIDLALANPERVAALVLIGSAVSGAPDPDITQESIASIVTAAQAADKAGDVDEVNRLDAHLWLDGPTAPEGRVGGRVRELFLEMNGRALRAPDPGETVQSGDAWPRLGEIRVPTLVLVGDLDLLDIQEINEQLAQQIGGARFVRLRGVAHLPHLEGDESCLREIASFLATI
jgi:pimeloyl-ACP methyl ester carboxylesterase